LCTFPNTPWTFHRNPPITPIQNQSNLVLVLLSPILALAPSFVPSAPGLSRRPRSVAPVDLGLFGRPRSSGGDACARHRLCRRASCAGLHGPPPYCHVHFIVSEMANQPPPYCQVDFIVSEMANQEVFTGSVLNHHSCWEFYFDTSLLLV
jgi:hypothetical protein